MPTTGRCLQWLDETGEGWETCLDGELLAPALGSQVPGSKKSPRRDAERRCRVPLILGNPGIKPRPLPSCAFRRSASLVSYGGRFSEPQLTRMHLRAAMTLARTKGTAASAQTFQSRMLGRQMLVYIQILRFLAALAVVAFHVLGVRQRVSRSPIAPSPSRCPMAAVASTCFSSFPGLSFFMRPIASAHN